VKAGQFEATWLMVACFFALFSLPAFLYLPPDEKGRVSMVDAALRGLRYTWKNLKEIWERRQARRFLISYLLYEDGVNTVIVFSSVFAATTLGFAPKDLIVLYLLVQVTALLGAFVLARPIDYWGPKKVVMLSLLLWTLVAAIAFFIRTQGQFWLLACFAGLGLGTVQAASRALYAQFVPDGKEAEYFGTYALVGKSSAILGPLRLRLFHLWQPATGDPFRGSLFPRRNACPLLGQGRLSRRKRKRREADILRALSLIPASPASSG
jgi:UMF1 family MFS transporter